MVEVASDTAVLIVEDDASTTDLLRRALGKRNITDKRITSVGNGETALKFLLNNKPCCMIIDDYLPGITGLELLDLIKGRAEYQDVQIFFYSSNLDWERHTAAVNLGAKRWFVKGVSRLGDLIDRIVAACEPK